MHFLRSVIVSQQQFRDGVVGNISACHADARGSIPRRGDQKNFIHDTLAEWLRRQPAKLLGSARAGSNPAGVDIIFLLLVCHPCTQIFMQRDYFTTDIRINFSAGSQKILSICRVFIAKHTHEKILRMHADTCLEEKSVVTLSHKIVPVAQRIRRETTNLKIAGSNPVGDTSNFCTQQHRFYGVIGYHSGL